MPKLNQEILPAFSPEDVRKLVDAAHDARETVILLFLLDGGCRLSEFLALDVCDVDVKTGAVKIRLDKRSAGVVDQSMIQRVSWRSGYSTSYWLDIFAVRPIPSPDVAPCSAPSRRRAERFWSSWR